MYFCASFTAFYMNLYIRYFQNETLVHSVEEALDFLSSITDIDVDEFLEQDLRQFVNSDSHYPKRYKVGTRSYFIVIKADVDTLEEFKEHGAQKQEIIQKQQERKERQDVYAEVNPGWYDASLTFKRVISIPQTSKFQYRDATFRARVRAESIQDCYNRILDHLRSRHDIDPRSQFPSIKGRNFVCEFLGESPE